MAGHAPYAALYTLTWVILKEDFSWPQVLVGLVFAVMAIAMTKSTLLAEEYRGLYGINLFRLVGFYLLLIPLMYKSGLSAIGRIIRGQDDVCIVRYTSQLQDDLLLMLLANAITLTPGTVTVKIAANDLQILSFKSLTDSSMQNDFKSVRRIERILGGIP